MSPKRFEDAVEHLRERIPGNSATAVVLFGSVARGEATEDSDIDLLIIRKRGHDDEEALQAVRAVEGEDHVRIATVFTGPGMRDLDRQFLDSILRQGRTLVGKMPKVDVQELDLEPVRLVRFDLRGLPGAKKVRLARELFGYTTRKRYKRKVYTRQTRGLLEAWGGRQIGRGTVIVPESRASEVDSFLRSRGAKRIIVPVWIQRP